MSGSTIFVTVVIRSYKRVPYMIELVKECLGQRYEKFEVLVIEQSGEELEGYSSLIGKLEQDKRFRLVTVAQLGPAGARNEALRLARGDILLFIDDDDLPIGKEFIANHAENYKDESIIGVSGRVVHTIDEQCDYKKRKKAERLCLKYGYFGYPYVYCRLDKFIEPVDWLHGSNASVRKNHALQVNGWDETFWDHEEHSFAFRLHKILSTRDRLVFDPRPKALRRTDIPGGLDRRNTTFATTFDRNFLYYHRLVSHYRTSRFVIFYGIYLCLIMSLTVKWIWMDSALYNTKIKKIFATLSFICCSPLLYCYSLSRLFWTRIPIK
jgi:glycosyltransferase involved in cell wall biosynthesis